MLKLYLRSEGNAAFHNFFQGVFRQWRHNVWNYAICWLLVYTNKTNLQRELEFSVYTHILNLSNNVIYVLFYSWFCFFLDDCSHSRAAPFIGLWYSIDNLTNSVVLVCCICEHEVQSWAFELCVQRLLNVYSC